MIEVILIKICLIEGVWEGVLIGLLFDSLLMIVVEYLGKLLDGVEVMGFDNGWGVCVLILVELILDGV